MEAQAKNQYKSVFKATALFGGVQIWQILIGIVRSKLVALILGPAGMGITGLYTSSTALIQSLTNFGLSSSSVKYIAEAHGSGDLPRMSRVIVVLKRLMWMTGLAGMLAVIIFSPWLSKSAFGNYDYTIAFILLSVTLLLQQLSSGNLSVLQGTRKLKSLAKASIIGSVLGLFTTIPLYYLWGTKGIVPSLIIAGFTSFALNWYFAHKVTLATVRVTNRDALRDGRGMIGMGLAMTLNGILATAVAYIIRLYIANTGGTSEVGLYTAGMTILTVYVGMIFSAMSTDFFPRLSAVCNDNQKCTELVNQQAEIALLILSPVLACFIICAPLAIIILYSRDFLMTVPYMQWAALGMMFKALSWAISFLFIAKSDLKTFVANEFLANVITLLSSLGGYFFWGLEGLGIAFLTSYVLYFLLVWIVSLRRYGFSINRSLWQISMISLFLISSTFIILVIIPHTWRYVPAVVLTTIGIIHSYVELDKRIGIKEYVMKRLQR